MANSLALEARRAASCSGEMVIGPLAGLLRPVIVLENEQVLKW